MKSARFWCFKVENIELAKEEFKTELRPVNLSIRDEIKAVILAFLLLLLVLLLLLQQQLK